MDVGVSGGGGVKVGGSVGSGVIVGGGMTSAGPAIPSASVMRVGVLTG
jgi:hypothetical protein